MTAGRLPRSTTGGRSRSPRSSSPSTDKSLASQVAAVRRFTRYFTSVIGVLEEGYLHSAFSVTEARVLYELAAAGELSAIDLVRLLQLDAGYVSRLLGAFERDGLVERVPSPDDARRTLVKLTPKGREAFAPLDVGADRLAGDLLAPLAAADRARVVDAMRLIEQLLSEAESRGPERSARRGSGRSR